MKEVKNIEITGINSEGKGVGRSTEFEKVLFIKNAVMHSNVDAIIIKEEKNFALAEVTKINKHSSFEVNPICKHYGICGGCNVSHISYKGQLEFKKEQVLNAFKKIAKIESPNIFEITPSSQEFYYRNKMDFQFSSLSWIINGETERRALGMHIEGRFDRILNITQCHLHSTIINEIRNFIYQFAIQKNASFYNPKTKTGLLRNLIFRESESDLAVILVFSTAPKVFQAELCMALKAKFTQITAIFWGVNKKEEEQLNDVKLFAFKGEESIKTKIFDLNFEINLKSFAQINSEVATKMVKKVTELAGENKIIYDLYSGIGTFTLPLSKNALKVIGIESSKFSYNDAKNNAMLNKIENVQFIKGMVEDVITEEFILENGSADLWVMDPPRQGLSGKVLQSILRFKPKKIIYISCNSATLARDAKELLQEYSLKEAYPFDMFPQTSHVEIVSVFEKL